MKKSILRGIFVTSFVFLTMLGVDRLSDLKVLSAFDPISQALAEFQLTDYVFSKLREPPPIDTTIVLVNLSQASRRDLAYALQIISKYKPKVIGIDSFFNCEGGFYDTLNCPQLLDTLGNLMLSNAIQEAGNVVMVSRLLQTDSLLKTDPGHVFDTMEYSDPIFTDYAKTGFANLPTGDEDGHGTATYQEDVKICRSVIPKMTMLNGRQELAFSVRMAMEFDSVKTKKFLARSNQEEVINFRGNADVSDVKLKAHREQMRETSEFKLLCYAIDWIPLIEEDFDSTLFTNKIVIFGYLGDYFGDPAWEDKFFTPLNTKVAGRANPDMFGPVIHANIVSMILKEDYVNQISLATQVLIATIACFFNVLLFYWIDKKFPVLYDGLSVVLQIFEIIVVSAITVNVFANYSLKLDLTLTIAALALIGPCFDIYKSIENSIEKRLTTKRKKVLTTQDVEIS